MKKLMFATVVVVGGTAVGIGLLTSWTTLALTVLFPVLIISSGALITEVTVSSIAKKLGGIRDTFEGFATVVNN